VPVTSTIMYVGLFWNIYRALLGLCLGLFACHMHSNVCRALSEYIQGFFGIYTGLFWNLHRALLALT